MCTSIRQLKFSYENAATAFVDSILCACARSAVLKEHTFKRVRGTTNFQKRLPRPPPIGDGGCRKRSVNKALVDGLPSPENRKRAAVRVRQHTAAPSKAQRCCDMSDIVATVESEQKHYETTL